MNEENIIYQYVELRETLRSIAKMNNTNHHKIKRILIKNNIEINNSNRKKRVFTEEHKAKISESSKGRKSCNKGKKATKEMLYKNMASHLRWDVDIEFLKQYEDIEKIKMLNSILTRDRVAEHFDTDKYKIFIDKFYNDKQFNEVYDTYIKENMANYAKPSLDHIIPLSKGGTWEFDNLQILSWVENRAKYNFMPQEWEYIKKTFLSTL